MGRAPCCDKANVKKGPWSPEEDAKLKSYIEQQGTGGNWIALPQKIGLKRCGKSCRLRWLNYLRPNIKHGGFSEEEDNLICSLYISIGSRWSIIAAQLPGRTDNDIKNYWNTRLKKKLLGKQRKEQHARRGSSGLKQEITRKGKENSLVYDNNNNNNNQNLYWPEFPLLAPTEYANQDTHPSDHVSIRKLLIKLGGRFSSHDHDQETHDGTNIHHHLPMGVSSIQTPYESSIDALNPNASHLVANTHYSIMPGQNNFQAELQELVYNNPQRLDGMEFLYEDAMYNNRNGTSCGEGIQYLCGISSMVSPQVGSSYEGIQQGIMQECAFDELRYPPAQ